MGILEFKSCHLVGLLDSRVRQAAFAQGQDRPGHGSEGFLGNSPFSTRCYGQLMLSRELGELALVCLCRQLLSWAQHGTVISQRHASCALPYGVLPTELLLD